MEKNIEEKAGKHDINGYFDELPSYFQDAPANSSQQDSMASHRFSIQQIGALKFMSGGSARQNILGRGGGPNQLRNLSSFGAASADTNSNDQGFLSIPENDAQDKLLRMTSNSSSKDSASKFTGYFGAGNKDNLAN